MFTPSSAWYKHGPGKIFLIFLAFLGITMASFGSLVGYYLWQYKHGKLEVVEKKLYAGRQSTIGNAQDQTKNTIVKEPQKLIRAHNPTIGDAMAPLTIIMFIDFECPFCQADYDMIKKMREQYSGAARFVFKHFPVESLHPNARAAAIAASCAAEEGKFWPFYDELFQKKNLTEEGLEKAAIATKVKTARFDTCRSTYRTASFLEEDMADAFSIGIRGTPTYVVNGIRIDGNIPASEWEQILITALKNRGTKP